MSRTNSVPPAQPQPRDREGEAFDVVADNLAKLSWSDDQGEFVLVRGPSDFNLLRGLKNSLLAIRTDFSGDNAIKVVIEGDKKEDFNRRLLLLESEIEGLLKRRINFSLKDTEGGHRTLDYTNILNEKENQIVELEKKIQNYEERLRRTAAREAELENHILALRADLKRRDDILRSKADVIVAEFALSEGFRESLNRIKRNFDANRNKFPADAERVLFDGVVIPAADSIKADTLTKDGAVARTSVSSDSTRLKGQLVTLFREIERLAASPELTQDAVDRVLEGGLLSFNGSRLRESLTIGLEKVKAEERLTKLRSQFGVAAGLFKTQIEAWRRQFPNGRFEFDNSVLDILRGDNIEIVNLNGVVHVERFTERTVEVPVQDARTKHLIHLLSIQMKTFFNKYPKLRDEIDGRLFEFFQQEIIDVIEVDELDRVVEIVKYVPQVVKVENVYAYSSQKSKRIEFHLRVLVKALLEELEKIKARTGLVLEIDEGIIAMINQEIMGVIDVDDILKVFRIVPKIVEVEKIVEKVVERIIEVPQVIPIEKIVEKVVEVVKVQEIEKIVHVPVEIIKYVDNVVEKVVEVEKIIERVVEVPRVIEKVVERVVEIPKVQQVTNIVEKIVEKEVPVTVERVVNHVVTEYKEVEVVRDRTVPTERVVERIVEVPTIVEKIVEKIVQVPQIIEVEKVVEKIVKVVEYKNAREVVNNIQTVYEVVDRIIEKPIPVVQTVEKIVEVPQVIEKIVQVNSTTEVLKEVKVIEEKIVYVDRIKEVEKIVTKTVPLIQEVEKIVDRRVEVPIVVEKIVKVPEVVTQIVVERAEIPKIIEVEKIVEKIVEVTKIVEVEKPVNHYIRENQVTQVVVEKIVEVPRTVERIKEVRVPIDKIIEKMVEVPKVVEVEKIVEKIVVVPRVIEKIVEVPQIVQQVVDRIVEVEKIREVERIVNVPVITEKLVEVEVIKNIYQEVEKVVERIVEKIVPVERVIETTNTVQQVVEKIIEVKVEVPKTIETEKIVTKVVEVEKVVEIERPTTVPIEVPVPVDRVIEKIVAVNRDTEKIVQVPQVIEKIVQVKVEDIRFQDIERLVDKIIVQEKIKEVEKVVPYIQETVKEVPTFKEKVVPVQSIVQEIQTVPTVVEKIVTVTNEVPRIVEVERIVEKLVQVPQIAEIELITPVIVKVNQIIEAIREKTIEIPVIQQEIVEVPTIQEKIVAVNSNATEIREVVVNRDKIVEVDRFITKTDTIPAIQDRVVTVDRFEERSVPVFSTVEKIVEVPYILEKIVEKIVIMPQVVEVLKYVHEIVEEETLGVAVGVDITVQEARYKELYGLVKVKFEVLLAELRKLRTRNPEFKIQIDIIEKFLIEFDKLAAFQRIVAIERDHIVEVEKNVPVLVPTRDNYAIRTELANALLIEKLIVELKRLRSENPNIKFRLDEDVTLLFFPELYSNTSNLPANLNEELNNQLKSYTDTVIRKFTSLGGNWATDHELMLNTVLQERFAMAALIREANLEIEKARKVADQRLEGLRRYKLLSDNFEKKYHTLVEGELSRFSSHPEFSGVVTKILGDFGNFLSTDVRTITYTEEPLSILGEIHGTDGNFVRIQSVLRERDAEVQLLRERLVSLEKDRPNPALLASDQSRTISNLRNEVTALNNQLSSLRGQSSVNVNISANTQEYEIKIRTLNSRIQELESQNRTLRIDYDGQIRNAKSETERVQRESALKISELERKINNYEREIKTLNDSIADYKRKLGDNPTANVTPVTTPVSRTTVGGDNSVTSSGIPLVNSQYQIGQTTPVSNTSGRLSGAVNLTNSGTGLVTSQYGSVSGNVVTPAKPSSAVTNSSSTYTPGQYSSGVYNSASGLSGVSGTGLVTSGTYTPGATSTGAYTPSASTTATGYTPSGTATGAGYTSYGYGNTGSYRASGTGLPSATGSVSSSLTGSVSGTTPAGTTTYTAGNTGASGTTYSTGASGTTYSSGSTGASGTTYSSGSTGGASGTGSYSYRRV